MPSASTAIPETPKPDTLSPATPEPVSLPPSIAVFPPGALAMIAALSVAFTLRVIALMLVALKLPVESRLTMALAVSFGVGASFQFRARVPLPVTGEPLTVKSELGALRPTLVTVPLPAPGNVWPEANVNKPLLLIFRPVSAGVPDPDAKSRLMAPDGLAVSLLTGSACHWNFSPTVVEFELLKAAAVKVCGCEFLPAEAVAAPRDIMFRAPCTFSVPLTARVAAGEEVPMPTFAVAPVPD